MWVLSIIIDCIQGLLTYHVANHGDMWHKLYTIIEENKHKLNLSDYSISQATLEQVTKIYFADTTQIYSFLGVPEFCKIAA